MNNGEKNNQDITKSLSKISEYSDAFDNYDDVVRYSKALNMIEKKLPNRFYNFSNIYQISPQE